MTQPKLITKPFADDALPGYVTEIPKENPVGAPEQNASWSVGFPPITMTDIDDGGLPPNGEDMNGVLRAITEHNLFIGGGGVYEFADEYIAEVGGYSKGAVLVSDDKTALWMSIQDNNTQNFNGATKNQWRRIAFTELDSTLTSIQGALNTKADKSVTITASDGLTGGGTLARDRVLAVNSTVVRTDRTIATSTGLSGGGDLSANRTLSVNYGTTAGTAAQGNDSRITGAAQKSANLSDLSSAPAARQNLGLGTAATRNVGVDWGNVMEVGAFGLGASTYHSGDTLVGGGNRIVNRHSGEGGLPNVGGWSDRSGVIVMNSLNHHSWIQVTNTGLYFAWANMANNTTLPQFKRAVSTDDIQSTTGQSTEYPMTQKAVTDALGTKADQTALNATNTEVSKKADQTALNATNTEVSKKADQTALNATNTEVSKKADSSTQVIAGPGLSGGGNLTANRTLSVNYGTTAGTAAQGNDSRIVNSVQTSGNQTIGGIKTFSSFPVTPSAAPTDNYQAANKKYVDDSAIGVGQTWQKVTGSRVAGTTYTNTTGRPIMVSVRSNVDDGWSQLTVGGIAVAASGSTQGPGDDRHTVCAIVPNGVSYSYGGSAIALWAELR